MLVRLLSFFLFLLFSSIPWYDKNRKGKKEDGGEERVFYKHTNGGLTLIAAEAATPTAGIATLDYACVLAY